MGRFMGKKIIITSFAIFLLFCSCQTKPVVWDDSLPDASMATVQLVNMNIDSFNGIAVTKFFWVKIPAGEVRLGGDVTIYHAGVGFRAQGMEFTCRFDAGREYVVQGTAQDMLWGVSVYEASKYSQISEANKIMFIPFKEQPVRN